ncbi:MAG: hypothetical protein GY804_06100 [Alphaproteobacteria bacterium]|nr:hypothetical protein [Alphaproteobacteria bacterium]
MLDKRSSVSSVVQLRSLGCDARDYVSEDDIRSRVLCGFSFVLEGIRNLDIKTTNIAMIASVATDAVVCAPARQASKGYSNFRDIIAQANPEQAYDDDPRNALVDYAYEVGCKIKDGADAARLKGDASGDAVIYEGQLGDDFASLLINVVKQSEIGEQEKKDIVKELSLPDEEVHQDLTNAIARLIGWQRGN